VALQAVALRAVALQAVALRVVALQAVALRVVALQAVALRVVAPGLAWLVAALLPAGCAHELQGDPVPDAPPQTAVTGVPPVLDRAAFTVTFFWTGTDADGYVDHYEWRISDDGKDGRVDVADTLGLRWRRTSATDSTFSVSADLDSFPPDAHDPRRDPGHVRYWQMHTLFTRAVDNEGQADPTPASISFTATTLAPTVQITSPAIHTTNTCVGTSRVLTFGWVGDDPDDLSRRPVAVRYVLSEVPKCLLRGEYEAANPLASLPDSAWTDWIAYNAPGDSGRVVTYNRLELGRKLLFAVQAKDRAGAVTPVFEWGVNVLHLDVNPTKRPLLHVSEPSLGEIESASTSTVSTAEVIGSQLLTYTWSASASEYGGVITAYRYGWDVQDVNDRNDPGWAVQWGQGDFFRRAPPHSFTGGNHNFVVQVLDNSGTLSRVLYQLNVVAVKPRSQQRPLLLVEDWPRSTNANETALDVDWDSRWIYLLGGRAGGFGPADVLDTADDPLRYTFRTFNDYRAVVYFTKGGDTRTRFYANFAAATRRESSFNWLELYQQRIGNVLFIGPQAMYNAFESGSPVWKLPVIFTAGEAPPLGFGQVTGADGRKYPVGVARYPYTAFCVDAVDYVRPPPGDIYGEFLGVETQKRTRDCDAMSTAAVDSGFLGQYPSARGIVDDLPPRPERTARFATSWGLYRLDREEFYNRNITTRSVELTTRPCQQVMYRLRARRDQGYIAAPDIACYPLQRARSVLDGVPVAIVSTVYSQTKPVPGSEDYLWGFNPLAFQLDHVRTSLRWIFDERWQIDER
jgi:hypothetical protein